MRLVGGFYQAERGLRVDVLGDALGTEPSVRYLGPDPALPLGHRHPAVTLHRRLGLTQDDIRPEDR